VGLPFSESKRDYRSTHTTDELTGITGFRRRLEAGLILLDTAPPLGFRAIIGAAERGAGYLMSASHSDTVRMLVMFNGVRI